MNEREKTVENRYKSLLSESNKKSHSQEQLIRHLTESSNQRGKDLLLQVPNLFFLLYLTFDLAQFFWCCFFNSFCRSIYIKIRLAAMIITFITIYRCTLELYVIWASATREVSLEKQVRKGKELILGHVTSERQVPFRP